MATWSSSELERGQDETFDFLCTVCSKKNRNTEAVKFCPDCNDYYCSRCIRTHDEIPVLKSHSILDILQSSSRSTSKIPVVPTERCTAHGHKPVDMYCQEHDKVGCLICMTLRHNSCQEKFYIPEYVKTRRVDTNTKGTLKQLDEMVQKLKKRQKALTKSKEGLSGQRFKSLRQIKEFRNEINKQLDAMEKNTVTDCDQSFQSLMEKTAAKLSELEDLLSEIERAKTSLASCGRNLTQQFVSNKKVIAVATTVEEKLKDRSYNDSASAISFTPNEKIISMLNQLQALGCVSKAGNVNPTQLVQTLESTEAITEGRALSNLAIKSPRKKAITDRTLSTPLLQAKGKSTYSVEQHDDQDSCDIIGACVLEDGTVVLADFKNTKLKRFDTSTCKVQDSCDLPDTPWRVCTTGRKEVAVTCSKVYSSSDCVYFVTVGRSMRKTRQINIDFSCCGLAYADNKLYLSDSKSVNVYTLSGVLLKKVRYSQFSDIFSLAVSNDGSKIYIADKNNGMIILNSEGKCVGLFNGRELKWPYDICLYKDDSLLVCVQDFNSVLQFTADGKLTGEVLKMEQNFRAISCDFWRNMKLILSVSHSNEIEIYDIQ